MSNAQLFQFRYSKERDLVDLQFKVSVGASGAPTVVNGKGLLSITRNSAGNYTLVLRDRYFLFMDSHVMFISGSSAPAAPLVNLVSEQVNNASSPQVIMQCRDIAAAAADPASGEVMLIKIKCRNAST
jgi:hypothetical protein